MSWRASGYVKSIRAGITQTEKLLLLCLADYYDDEIEAAWPSTISLAQDALLSERQTRTLLQRLAKKGFLEVIKTPGRPNRFHLPWLKSGAVGAPILSDGGAVLAVVQSSHGAIATAPPVVQSSQGGGAVSRTSGAVGVPKVIDEPSLEPSLEPSEQPTVGRRKKQERPTELTPEELQTLYGDFKDIGPPIDLDELIADAMNYYLPRFRKGDYDSIYLCVRGSLSRERTRRGGKPNGRTNGSPNVLPQRQANPEKATIRRSTG